MSFSGELTGRSIGSNHPEIRAIRRSTNVPTLSRTVFVVYLLVVPFSVWAYGASLVEWLAATGVGAVVVLVGYYQVRSWHRRRLAMAERAVEVPIEPRDVHVVEDRPVNPSRPGATVTYDWAVEFRYEHDRGTATSFYVYPDGCHMKSSTLSGARETAKSRLGRAGETGYYDPETDQAFLYDRPNGDAYRSDLLGVGFHAVVVAVVMGGLYILVFSPPLPV